MAYDEGLAARLEEALNAWVARCIEFVSTLPNKKPKAPRRNRG